MADGLLDGKVAIVAGGGRGIGRSIAMLMAEHGARVIVNDLGVEADGNSPSRGPADDVVEEIKGKGGTAVASFESVATAQGGESIIKAALEHLRQAGHPGQSRGHPAGPDGVQHDGGRVGRGHRSPPLRALQSDQAGEHHHAAAAFGPHHPLLVDLRSVGELGPGQLRRRQGRRRGADAGGGPGPWALRRHVQRHISIG